MQIVAGERFEALRWVAVEGRGEWALCGSMDNATGVQSFQEDNDGECIQTRGMNVLTNEE